MHVHGQLFIVATPAQLRVCAPVLADNCRDLTIHRIGAGPTPRIAAVAMRAYHVQSDADRERRRKRLSITDSGHRDGHGAPIKLLPPYPRRADTLVHTTSDYNTATPVITMPYAPRQLVAAAQRHGSWQHPQVAQLFRNDHAPPAIRPIERLPEGHSALIAANSMIDHALIKDPTGQNNPVIVRGFFNKTNRATFTTAEVIKRTDFYESNILAMDAVTGEVSEVGRTADGLREFMDAYGSAIRHHIDTLYPPTVDINSPEYAAVGACIDAIPRPLIGKQRHAAIAGAMHLRRNPHLNFFATQGSGKTCTAAGMVKGMTARIVAVVTPARIVPNWIDEIRAVFPDAIIRVVRNENPIGSPQPDEIPGLTAAPAPFARASLAEIRATMPHATPDAPLWIILKKDSARASYPVQPVYREVWPHDRAPAQPLHRPLARLVQTETCAGAKPMPGASANPTARPKRLMRYFSQSLGNNQPVSKFTRNPNAYSINRGYDPQKPTKCCPNCWQPIVNHPTNKDQPNRDDRRRRCPSDAEYPRFPKLYREWQAARAQVQDDGDEVLDPPGTRKCDFPLAQPQLDQHGRRIYSYGDYFTRRMIKLVDLLIIDESQDYKARDTLQGAVIRRMAQRAKRTIALTGTPFGGRVSDFFYQLIAFNPDFSKDYNYHQHSRFVKDFGRQEVTETLRVVPGNRFPRWHSSRRAIPGYHPKLLTYFWNNTIFMDLDEVDVRGILPSFTQHARLVDMDDQFQGQSGHSQQTAYEALDEAFAAAMSAATQARRNSRTSKATAAAHRPVSAPTSRR